MSIFSHRTPSQLNVEAQVVITSRGTGSCEATANSPLATSSTLNVINSKLLAEGHNVCVATAHTNPRKLLTLSLGHKYLGDTYSPRHLLLNLVPASRNPAS
jgi:hypothetical protein